MLQPRSSGCLGLVVALAWLNMCPPARADDTNPGLFGEPQTRPVRQAAQVASGMPQQYQFGVVLTAQGSSIRNASGTITVPADWPGQQKVRVVKQDLPPGATVGYKTIEDVGRQMIVRIPSIAAGSEARAVVTFEVEVLAPAEFTGDAQSLTAPERRKLDRKVAIHLTPSPKIESDAPAVRKTSEELVSQSSTAWEKVQAIHKWVHQNIVFDSSFDNVRTCLQTLEVRRGVCAEKASLAIALLRAAGLPARLVRIPGHVYYEVYLLDADGRGHWFSGDPTMSDTISLTGRALGVVLQKGDNVTLIDPQTKRTTKGRFLADSAGGTPQAPGGSLQFQALSPAMTADPRIPKAAKPVTP